MRRFVSVILLGMLIVFASCKRSQLNEDTTSAEDNALAQDLWDEIGNQVETSSIHAEYDSTQNRNWGVCGTLSLDTTPGIWPNTITIDFGETNCTGTDGRERRGKVHYTLTAPYRTEGMTMTVTTDDYFVNDYGVEGVRTVINKGNDIDGHPVFEINVEDALVTTLDNANITWSSTRTRTWVNGHETHYFTLDSAGGFMGLEGILDDVYEISGSAEGVDREGRSFTMQISEALRLELDCNWITSGVLKLTPEDLDTRTMDYGDGACDNDADVTIGDKTYTISLRG